MKLQNLRASAIQQLQTSSPTAQLDTDVLLEHVLAKPRSYLIAHPNLALDEPQQQQFHQLLTRRLQGEPIAYILGQREFWSLPLIINAHVLIPRPETELLVELALERIPQQQAYQIADLGTGSGAIALAIAKERPLCHLYAIDLSMHATHLTQHNAARLQLPNVSPIQTSWCESLAPQSLDMIVSNPPYIALEDVHLNEGDVRFEPRLALCAGADGMAAYDAIISQAARCLKPGGHLILEHGYHQQTALQELLQQHGYRDILLHSDLAGVPRAISGIYGC